MAEIDWIEKAKKTDLSVRNFIDGQHVEYHGAETIAKYSPRDGSLLYEVNIGENKDVNQAVASAKETFSDGRWSRHTTSARKAVLHKLADLMEEHAEELALLECLDVGKPINGALTQDVPMAVATLRYYADAADKLFGKVHISNKRDLTYQMRRPIGVVGGIIGWNFPLLLAATKIGPALAMGNSLVLKPSEITSLSANRIAELAVRAGLPEGVFNIVHGTGPTVGAALAHHHDVNMLTFTGSSITGKQLLIAAGNSNMKRLLLECGGKSPNIIFDDCPSDYDGVAEAVVMSAFWNQGEVCSAGTRLLIQENIKDKLLPKILERAANFIPNDPLNPATTFGALVSQDHMNKVLAYIDSGKQQGAKIIYGGERVTLDNDGFYVQPTVFDEVDPNQKIAQEEIFGPVLSVLTFRDEEEALKIANNSSFGLTATVWTQNLARAQRISQGIEAGFISIQGTTKPSPGGAAVPLEAHKESGFGREAGIEGLESYTINSSIQILV